MVSHHRVCLSRMYRYTVTNSLLLSPNPGLPMMATPGMGFISPSFDGQQITVSAPFSYFSFIPPPPIPSFPPSFSNQRMPFTTGGKKFLLVFERPLINRSIKYFGKGGGEGLNEFVKKFVAQERRVAMLKRQQGAQKSGESG